MDKKYPSVEEMEQQEVTVISSIYSDSILKGFLVVDSLGAVFQLPLDSLRMLHDDIIFRNAKYDEKFGTLVGTGVDLVSYPRITPEYDLIGKNGIIVHSLVKTSDSDKVIGVVAYTATGMRLNITIDKLVSVCKGIKEINFDLVVDTEGYSVESKTGQPFPSVVLKKSLKNRFYRSSDGQTGEDIEDLTNDKKELVVATLDEVALKELHTDAQQRLMNAVLALHRVAPYYGVIYSTLNKVYMPGKGTFGVTEDKFFFDYSLPARLSTPELVFILIHECMHIAMQHSFRQGKRIHSLWNIATDLYINTIICNDFGIQYGGEEKVISVEQTKGIDGSGTGGMENEYSIKVPSFGIFLDTIGETLDLAKDSPESIYAKLVEENKDDISSAMKDAMQNAMNQSQSGQQSGQQQASQQGGQQQDSQQGGQQGEGGQQSDKQDGQQDMKAGTTDNNTESSDDSASESGTEATANKDDKDTSEDSNNNSGFEQVTVKYNGKDLSGTIMKDVFTNDASASKEADEKNLQDTRNALQRMKTKIDMEREKGNDVSKDYGHGGALTQRHIDFGISDHIDWKVLLKNILVKSPKKTYTLAMPNVDYMSMGMTVAERHKIGRPTQASDIVIAIDVSGSVSKETLDLYLSEVNNMLKRYDVEVTLVYWSTEIGAFGTFSDIKGLLSVPPHSTVGTDVKCLFKFLSGETKVKGESCPIKVKDLKGLFIITDGRFSQNYASYADYFSRKTVWIIDGNVVLFEPCFGRVISLKGNN